MISILYFVGVRLHFDAGKSGNGFAAISTSALDGSTTSLSSPPGVTILPQELFRRSIGTSSIPSSTPFGESSSDDLGVASRWRLVGKAVWMLGSAWLGMVLSDLRGNRIAWAVANQSGR